MIRDPRQCCCCRAVDLESVIVSVRTSRHVYDRENTIGEQVTTSTLYKVHGADYEFVMRACREGDSDDGDDDVDDDAGDIERGVNEAPMSVRVKAARDARKSAAVSAASNPRASSGHELLRTSSVVETVSRSGRKIRRRVPD